jgi:hypothetical protein
MTSAIHNKSEERCYYFSSWLTTRKEDALVKIKGIKDISRTTQELKWVAGILRVDLINIECLKSKSQNRNCSGLLEQNKMLGTAESWIGLEKCEIRGYKTFNKRRCKLTRYGRNPGGLVLYVKNINDQYIREMQMEKII